MPNQVIIQKGFSPAVKHVGSWVGTKSTKPTIDKDGKPITVKNNRVANYVSQKKALMLFYDKTLPNGNDKRDIIMFRNWSFRTDEPEVVQFLDNHPAMGVDMWKEEFPKHIKDKMEIDRKIMTNNIDEFFLAEK